MSKVALINQSVTVADKKIRISRLHHFACEKISIYFTDFICFFFISKKFCAISLTFDRITLPDGVIGSSSTKYTPPSSHLYFANFSAIVKIKLVFYLSKFTSNFTESNLTCNQRIDFILCYRISFASNNNSSSQFCHLFTIEYIYSASILNCWIFN